MRKVITVIGVLVLVLLLGILVYSLVSQVSLPAAVQNVIGGIVGIVSDLGDALAGRCRASYPGQEDTESSLLPVSYLRSSPGTNGTGSRRATNRTGY